MYTCIVEFSSYYLRNCLCLPKSEHDPLPKQQGVNNEGLLTRGKLHNQMCPLTVIIQQENGEGLKGESEEKKPEGGMTNYTR